jgi:hypothetical protein
MAGRRPSLGWRLGLLLLATAPGALWGFAGWGGAPPAGRGRGVGFAVMLSQVRRAAGSECF